MAKIKLLPKKPKTYKRKQTDIRKERQKAYNSAAWKKLRMTYLMSHPMCEECGKKAATDIHHIKSFLVNGEVDWDLFLNEKNLMALCKECHGNHHSGKKIITDKILKEEDDTPTDYSITLL